MELKMPEEGEHLRGIQERRLRMTGTNERRKHMRVRLRWPVLLCGRGNGAGTETETENVSSAGFYCYLREALVPGETLDCIIRIPAWTSQSSERLSPERVVALRCSVEVTRVETAAKDGVFGIACRIRSYTVVRLPEQQPGDTTCLHQEPTAGDVWAAECA